MEGVSRGGVLDPPIGVAEALELGRRGLVAETDVIRTIEVTENTLRRLEKLGNRLAGQLHRRRAHFGREVELRKRGHRGRAARCVLSRGCAQMRAALAAQRDVACSPAWQQAVARAEKRAQD